MGVPFTVGHSDSIVLESSGIERTKPGLSAVGLVVWSAKLIREERTVCLFVLAHEGKRVKVEVAMVVSFRPAPSQMSKGER